MRELKGANDEDVRDIFKRFNKYVTKLNDQEIRQATYAGPFMQLAWRLADDDLWVQLKLVSPAQIRRMKDVEFVSELIIGTMHGPQGGSAKYIDEYYAQYEDFDEEFPGQALAEKRFNRVVRIASKLFETDVETRFRSNRTDFYSLFVACATTLIEHSLADAEIPKLRTTIVRFGLDIDKRLANEHSPVKNDVVQYVRAVEKGANDKKRRSDRHLALLGRIEPHFKPIKT